eukprot:966785_1
MDRRYANDDIMANNRIGWVCPKLKWNNPSSVSSCLRRTFESFGPLHQVSEPHCMAEEDECEIIPGSLPKRAPNIDQSDSKRVNQVVKEFEQTQNKKACLCKQERNGKATTNEWESIEIYEYYV